MTVQESPGGPQILMLMVVVAVLGLVAWAAVNGVRQRPIGRPVAVLAALLAMYTLALALVGATAGRRDLQPGDRKCFDEWCAGRPLVLPGSGQGTVTVQIQLENLGHRGQKSVLATAFIDSGDQRYWPENPGDLQAVIPPGGGVEVRLLFRIPRELTSARFVVTESAPGQFSPAMIVIGDESSPFHGAAGWPITIRP